MHARKRREELLGDRDAEQSDENADSTSHGLESTGDHAGSSAMKLDLERAMNVLTAQERAAIIQCYHNDLTHEEAAYVLGCPVGTVKTHVFRAKQKLKTALAAWGPDPVEGVS